MTVFDIFRLLAFILFIGTVVIGAIMSSRHKPKNKRAKDEWTPLQDGIAYAVFFTFMYLLVIGLSLLIGSAVASRYTPDLITTSERPLSALTLNSSMEGSITGGLFMTTGTLDSQEYYVVATVDAEGFSKVEKLPTDSVRYKETDTEVPRVIVTSRIKDNTKGIGKFWKVSEDEPRVSYTIYVPQGSVSNTINIDLKDI